MPISRNPEIGAAELDRQACLFNPKNAQYLNLNGTGPSIWNLLDVPMDVDALISAFQGRYGVDPDTCRRGHGPNGWPAGVPVDLLLPGGCGLPGEHSLAHPAAAASPNRLKAFAIPEES